MAFAYFDRVREISSTPGTGAVSLGGPVSGFISFSSVYSNGDTFYYTIADQNGSNWEVGLGTYTSSGNKLTRTTVLASSNSGSAVNFTSGSLFCFVTIAALAVKPGQLKGTATNDSASAGNVGEIITANVVIGSAVSLTTNMASSVTSISLTAGDWDVWGGVSFSAAGTTQVQVFISAISTIANAIPNQPTDALNQYYLPTAVTGLSTTQTAGYTSISVSTTTPIYLIAQSTFTVSAMSAYGIISARRRR